MEKLHIEEVDFDQFSSSSGDDVPLYLRLLLTHPSISKSGIRVHGPEQVVSPNEKISNDTRPLLSNHQETIGLPYVHQYFDATSATPVLTEPTSKPPSTNDSPSKSTLQRCNATSVMPEWHNSNTYLPADLPTQRANPCRYLLIV